VALRLDGDLEAILDTTEETPAAKPGPARRQNMKTERIDGVDYEVGSESWAQARARHDAAITERLTALEASVATLTKERDEAKGRADGLKAELDSATSPGALSAKVAARVELERKAAGLKRELKCDGLSDRAVMLAALGLEDKPELGDAYIAGRFDALVEQASRSDASLRETRIVAENADGSGERLSEMELAQIAHIERNRNAWKEGF